MGKDTEEKKLLPWQNALANSERKFTEIVEQTGTEVSYKVESMFALQAISKNDFLAKIANSNPNSLRDAIINIASIGLSLNPAMQYAYLVPRDGSACLDISYKGLIKLATDTGSIMWARADIIYSNDTFIYHGPAEKPEFKADVFGDRGEFAGVYCIAKTTDGDFLTELMTANEIFQVRDSSMAWAKKKSGPWKDWFGEMAKKTVIKRASKTWPRSDQNDRLANAIQVLNEHEGFDDKEVFDIESLKATLISQEQVLDIEALISEVKADTGKLLRFVGVDKIQDIPVDKYDDCVSLLEEMR